MDNFLWMVSYGYVSYGAGSAKGEAGRLSFPQRGIGGTEWKTGGRSRRLKGDIPSRAARPGLFPSAAVRPEGYSE